MPLMDLRWNIEQYYSLICDYINVPKEQFELDSRFLFHESLWMAEKYDKSFTIVEDEFCNLFDISRLFATREKEVGFVNVISESYMLRDYMCNNDSLFSNDPKAIPSIVPDYAKTERNFVIRLLTLMTVSQIKEKTLSKELALQGYETRMPYETFISLVRRVTGINDVGIRRIQNTGHSRNQVFLTSAYVADKSFVESLYDSSLKPAYYIVENEKTELYLIGNRLMGHIEQTLLPGQFFCFEGRYYQVRFISKENGIVVRRAGDHLNGRWYYRQLRKYKSFHLAQESSFRDLRGILIQSVSSDLQVETEGYYVMEARHLLNNASIVKFKDPRIREIKKKGILKVDFSDATDEIVFTLCDLFNELFRTVFPNDADYIVATTNAQRPKADGCDANILKSLVPEYDYEENGRAIFFIEDSNIDLGILEAIERNIQRLLEIITDYLDWYLDPKRERVSNDNEEQQNSDGTEPELECSDTVTSNENRVNIGMIRSRSSSVIVKNNIDDKSENGVEGEDEELFEGHVTHVLSRFRNVEYLTYGFEKEPSWLKLAETLSYLTSKNFNNSNLSRARRENRDDPDLIDYDPDQPGIHYCDFCGRVITKGNYEVLKDGRERCMECGSTAVKTGKQFRLVYEDTLSEMERIFGIQISTLIKVRMVNARKVNDGKTIEAFTPSPGFDSRVLGYATYKGKSYLLMVENGAPLWKMKATLVHELTHIWQFINWNTKENSPMDQSGRERDDLIEGMAVWAEVQYLMSMGRVEDAVRYRRNREQDKSEYGTGMMKYLAKYPVSKASSLSIKKTPFGHYPPL